jgi:hypothetical protein
MLTADHVRAAAELVGLPLSDDECAALLAQVRTYAELGAQLETVTSTDELPTDDPRWFTR